MTGQIILLCAIFVPLIGAFLLPIVGKVSTGWRNLLSLLFVLVSLIAAFIALPQSLGNNPYSITVDLPYGLSFGFLADGLAVFMAISASLLGAIIVFYSYGYIKSYDNQNEYYMMVTLFIGAMMGLVYSTNLIFIYLFWEISAICCWRLIGFFREKEIIRRADKAFLITVAGALVMLVGFIMIYSQTQTFDLTQMKGVSLSSGIVICILIGLLSKSATLPFHSWLPDAGVAPSPVTSLLHAAVLVKIGVYVFARLFLVNFTIPEIFTTNIIPIVAAVSALVSAGAALVENDLKRIVAYSTISQLAFIFLGLSTNTAIGIAGGILYIFMHGLAKGGLFLCAGVVEKATHTKDIRELGGLGKSMPITALAFLVCAFSVMGIPPFGGFFSKYMVVAGSAAVSPWIALTFIIGAVMTIMYLLRAFVKVFMGPVKYPKLKEGSWEMVFSVGLLGVLSLLAGIFINIPAHYVEAIVKLMGW